MLEVTGILFVAFLLDIFLGDPGYRFHPIRIIGACITVTEKALRRLGFNGKAGGIFLAVFVVGIFPCIYLALSIHLHRFFFPLGLCLDLYVCYSCLAMGDLINHIRPVISALQGGRLSEGRGLVAKVVGRDVRALDETGVCRASVETLAENFVDGFLSPLLWFVAGAVMAGSLGLVPAGTAVSLILAFKAASTLDSMVGYKNEKYARFGWAGARLDDLLNFIPARLSLPVLFLGAGLAGLRPLDGLRVAMADRLKHDSPNAGHPESFAAGALSIRLGGPTMYAGGLLDKPWLGNGNPDPGPVHIEKAVSLMRVSAWSAFFLCLSTLFLFM